MALDTLTLTTNFGVQGRPFRAKIDGLTTGVIEPAAGGSPGFSVVNGNLMHEALLDELSTVILREYAPGVGQGYHDTTIEITAATFEQVAAAAVGAIEDGRTVIGWRLADITRFDGTLDYVVLVENDLGSTVAVSLPTDEPVPDEISAPVLSQTSTTGANPIAFTIAVDDTVAVGMYWHLQVAADSGFSTSLRDETRIIGSDDFNGDAAFDSLTNMADGPTYVRLRVERDDGVMSDWSNVINDTLASIPANVTFDPTTKSQYLTLSNGNLTMVGNSSLNAAAGAKSTAAKVSGANPNDRGYAEFLMGATATAGERFVAAYDSATVTSGTNLPLPGGSGVAGIRYRSTGGIIHSNGTSVSAPAFTDGDVIGIYVNRTTDKAFFSKNGVWVTATGDPSSGGAGLPLGVTNDAQAGAATFRNNPITAAFKPADQTYLGTLQAWGS